MKIAFYVQFSHKTGTYFRWHNLALGLVRQGHQVHVYAGDYNHAAKRRTEIRDGITYFIVPSLVTSKIFGNPFDPFTALYRVLMQFNLKYDIYHLFQPFLQAYLPWQINKIFSTGTFFYDWDDLWYKGLYLNIVGTRNRCRAKLTGFFEGFLPTQAHATTVCSHYLFQKLDRNCNSQIVANGFWPSSHFNKKALRQKLSLNERKIYVSYIGKTAGELTWIADSFRLKQYSDVVLLIVGPPKNMVNDIFHDIPAVLNIGEVNQQEASEIAAAVDLGLIPLENSNFNQSRFPIKFFDFLSVGTPVYLSQVGDIANIAANLPYSFVAKPTKEDWMNGLDGVIEVIRSHVGYIDPNVIDDYSWINISFKLSEFYNFILAQKERPNKQILNGCNE